MYTSVVHAHWLSLQDWLKLEIDVTAPWNEGAKPPLQDWLARSQSEQDRNRLSCLGNIVVPLQARRAVSIISQIRAEGAALGP